MRISTKGRFAVNALVDLALRAPPGRWPWPRSASVSRFRCPTWNSCSAACAAWAWWKARAGPAAATRWAREPEQISVAEIVAAVDESLEDAARGCTARTLVPRCGSAWAR
jgi:Rrf2 family iron-sulfur cluster assembly transcriptional regulator